MTTKTEARRLQQQTVREIEEPEEFLAQVELLDLQVPKDIYAYILCSLSALKEEHGMWTDIASGVRT